MYNIDIHGSCVTRDAFEYDNNSLFKVNEFVSRCSIYSAISNPVNDIKIESDEVHSFGLKCIQTDFSKSLFERFKQSNSKILVIDLIDEGHNLLKLRNGSFVTNSVYLQESKVIEKEKLIFEKVNSGNFSDSIIDNAISIYADRLMRIYEPNQIVINRALLVREYKTLNGFVYAFPEERQQYITSMNCKLKKLYDKLESQFCNANIFIMPENTFADERHKWGLQPFHYTKEFYLEFINYLSVLCKKTI
jgi:hypothetical protein